MDTIEEQITNFSHKCDELLQAKFIIAPSKISDLLRAVAASPAIVHLFQHATAPFNYAAAQAKYLRPAHDAFYGDRGVMLLPDDPMELIAFVFCVLVDVDNGNVDFNNFLQTFFADEDGYAQSFAKFLTQIVFPFKEAVIALALPEDYANEKTTEQQRSGSDDVEKNEISEHSENNGATIESTFIEDEKKLKDEAKSTKKNKETKKLSEKQTKSKEDVAEQKKKRSRKAVFVALLPLIEEEKEELQESSLNEDDRLAGITMLKELYAAAKKADDKTLKALLFGYNYFIMQTKNVNETTAQIFDLASEL